jgi:hypothetical protein
MILTTSLLVLVLGGTFTKMIRAILKLLLLLLSVVVFLAKLATEAKREAMDLRKHAALVLKTARKPVTKEDANN